MSTKQMKRDKIAFAAERKGSTMVFEEALAATEAKIWR